MRALRGVEKVWNGVVGMLTGTVLTECTRNPVKLSTNFGACRVDDPPKLQWNLSDWGLPS